MKTLKVVVLSKSEPGGKRDGGISASSHIDEENCSESKVSAVSSFSHFVLIFLSLLYCKQKAFI